MTTEKWKDIAEITALLAVVASLLIVAAELRQTQVALQAQAYQARAFQAFDHHMDLAKNPALDILALDAEDPDFDIESLSEHDRRSLIRLYLSARSDVDNEHYQYENGFLDPSFYLTTTVDDIKHYAPVWRKLGIGEMRPEFTVEVDRILAEAE